MNKYLIVCLFLIVAVLVSFDNEKPKESVKETINKIKNKIKNKKENEVLETINNNLEPDLNIKNDLYKQDILNNVNEVLVEGNQRTRKLNPKYSNNLLLDPKLSEKSLEIANNKYKDIFNVWDGNIEN